MNAEEISRCIHGEASPCGCACPFDFDARAFLEKLRRGSFGAAFNLYRNAVLFPEIVSRICPAPCKAACNRVLDGEAVDMPALERAAIMHTRSTDPVSYNVPQKSGRIAVVGAGLSGLSCALVLAEMRYEVTVFERESGVAPSLEPMLSREIFEPEIMKQFKYTDCKFSFGVYIAELDELRDFDAVYLSAGAVINGDAQNVFRCPPECSPIFQIVAGKEISDDIEWFVKTGSRKPTAAKCAEVTEATGDVFAADAPELSKAEARQEAERCITCDCSACMKECVMLRQYGGTPKELARDVGLSLNIFPETQGRAAMRELGSCNFCGLCKKLCPVGVDLGGFLLNSRIELCQKGLLPPAHHDFWLRDMAFSNSDAAAVLYFPEQQCEYLFFPGCQSGGSDPRFVTMTYEKLRVKHPSSGLMLQCCGAAALWAGDAELFREVQRGIYETWIKAGQPTIAAGCPSCLRIFNDYLPELPVVSVYELDIFEAPMTVPFSEAAVFDPCASRDYPELQAAVRDIARLGGISITELRSSGEQAQCCSWGGHGYAVNPLFTSTLSKEQAAQSDLPYITYCTNCRDIFMAQGKNCRHILEIANGINDEPRKLPTVTERRQNRRELKRMLAKKYNLPEPLNVEEPVMQLKMDDALSEKMSRNLILEEEVIAVIASCEKDSRYLHDTASGHFIGHQQIGYITYWVEYSRESEGMYAVHNVYSHRMEIKAEYKS